MLPSFLSIMLAIRWSTGLSSTNSTRKLGWVPSSTRGIAGWTASGLGGWKGISTQKVDPTPTLLVTPICPSINWTSCWLMVNPRPVPPILRVADSSACVKGLNNFCWVASEIPMPVSGKIVYPPEISSIQVDSIKKISVWILGLRLDNSVCSSSCPLS